MPKVRVEAKIESFFDATMLKFAEVFQQTLAQVNRKAYLCRAFREGSGLSEKKARKDKIRFWFPCSDLERWVSG